MKISVAIPTYNRAHLITQTLDAIFEQSVTADEVVILDDGSTDNTEAVIRSYPHAVDYTQAPNAGPALARRRAIDRCRYDWIALCDSDDLWTPHHLSNFIACCKLYPEMDVYFSNFTILGSSESDKLSQAPPGWRETAFNPEKETRGYCLLSPDAYEAFLRFQPVFPSGLIFSKKFYQAIGGISESLGRIRSEDAHLIRRLIAHGITGCGQVPSVKIRKHEGNYSDDYVLNLQGRLAVLEDIWETRAVPERFLEITCKEICRSRLELFHHLYWAGRYQEALALSRRIGFTHFNLKSYVKILISFLRTAGGGS